MYLAVKTFPILREIGWRGFKVNWLNTLFHLGKAVN